ncbi:hypothetical protein [Actinoplanes palleronii]|nr:hypothetical protein [Actinoplanes palleronii]
MPIGWPEWDWGNVPSWVGSLLTGSSLALASFTYSRTSGDRRRVLEESERSQAARVSLWWINPRKALVRNSNDVAVTVQAFVEGTEDESPAAASEHLGIGPGQTWSLLLPVSSSSAPTRVDLAIVDGYGRRWIRRTGGTLDRITNEESLPALSPQAETPLRWEIQ